MAPGQGQVVPMKVAVKSKAKAAQDSKPELEPINTGKVPVPTVPGFETEEVLFALQQAGFRLNKADSDKKYMVTFELPPGYGQDGVNKKDPKADWPDTPYVRSAGPSVHLQRTGISQKKGCCGYKPPKCKGVQVDFRAADQDFGSDLTQTFAYKEPGDLKMNKDMWEFNAADGSNLVFFRDREKGCCCCKGQLPETGRMWQLLKDGNQLASVDVPEATEAACHCYCLPQPKCCICCGYEKILVKPKVWLRVRKPGDPNDKHKPGDTMFAIRNQERRDKNDKDCCGLCYLKCFPAICDYRRPTCPCAMCISGCKMGCGECCRTCKGCCKNCVGGCALCAKCQCAECCAQGCPKCMCCCCFGPVFPCNGCCDPPELIPIRAAGDGAANEMKKRGKFLKAFGNGMLENTHDIKSRLPDTPEVIGVPTQEVMVSFKFPAKLGHPSVPGPEVHAGTVCNVGERPKNTRMPKYVMHQTAVPTGTEVEEGEVVGWARESKHCCGLPCCPTCTGCPNYCALAACCPMLACCIQCCVNPPCCASKEEPEFQYEQVPVTGEWATSEKDPVYRVRAEVNANQTIGEAGILLSEVLAGLEKGTSQQEHLAFALVSFMELVQDERRPVFHVEREPLPTPSEGLPPRQQKMLGKQDKQKGKKKRRDGDDLEDAMDNLEEGMDAIEFVL